MRHNIGGIILAGGQSRRMGGMEKSLLALNGKTLLQRTIERASIQVEALALSANGDLTRFGDLSIPVLPDKLPGFVGPLAGILSGLRWLQDQRNDINWLASFAVDTPFFPLDLVDRLCSAAGNAKVVMPVSGGYCHPVFSLWRLDIVDELEEELDRRASRRMLDFIRRYPVAEVEFGNEDFLNINHPQDLEQAKRLLGQISGD